MKATLEDRINALPENHWLVWWPQDHPSNINTEELKQLVKAPTGEIILFRHVTDGGAVYLTDNHRIAQATLVIRLDGGPELVECKVKI